MSFVKLNEASLSRVYALKDKNGFAIFAVKEYGDDDITENKKLLEAKKIIREAGYGFIVLDGRYFERKDENSEWVEYPPEKSLFVPAKEKNDTTLKELVLKLADKYNQSTIFWADGDGSVKYVDVKTGSEVSSSLKKFTPDIPKKPNEKTKTNQYGYSILTKGSHKNRVFVFESILFPHGYINNMGLAAQGYDCVLAHEIVEGNITDSTHFRKLLEGSAFNAAYWISPAGKITQVSDNHISSIIRNPEVFGLSRDDIVETYKKYNEKIGQEGKAREEIIKSVIAKGFIRVRLYAKQGVWSINVNRLNDKNKDLIQQWAENIVKSGGDKYNTVNIYTIDDNSIISHSVDELSKDVLYSDNNYHGVFGERVLLCFVESFKKTDIELYFNRKSK